MKGVQKQVMLGGGTNPIGNARDQTDGKEPAQLGNTTQILRRIMLSSVIFVAQALCSVHGRKVASKDVAEARFGAPLAMDSHLVI